MSKFHATCRAPAHAWRSDSERERIWNHSAAHGHTGDELTFTDPAAWVAHRKVAGARAATGVRPVTCWKRPASKPFDPQVGEIGSWVTWQPTTWVSTDPDRYWVGRDEPVGAPLSGQVWSVSKGGSRPRVYVADGAVWHDVAVSELRPMVSVDAATFEDVAA